MRIVTLLLVALMTMAFVACTAAPSAGTSATPAPTTVATVAPTVAPTIDPLGKYDPPITISWIVSTSAVQQFKNGDTYDNNIWSRKIESDLGIKLSVLWSADGQTDAFRNKLIASIASGDLPDVFTFQAIDYQAFKQAVNAGTCADITNVYAQYAGQWMLDAQKNYADNFKAATFGGKLMAVPTLGNTQSEGNFLWIRADWLKNLNLQAPKTLDELVAVATAFHNNDPDKNNKQDTWGLGLQNVLFSQSFGNMIGVAAAYGVPVRDQGFWYRGDDGKVTYGSIQPAMKDALLFMQKLYKAGIIDPEFGSKDQTKLEADVVADKVGMAYGMQWNDWYPYNTVYTNEKVITDAYAIPTVAGTPYKMGIPSPAAGNMTCVNVNCKNPEAIIKMFNLYVATNNDNSTLENYNTFEKDEQYRFCPTVINTPQEMVYMPMIKKALQNNDGGVNLPRNVKNRFDLMQGFTTTGDVNGYGLYGQYKLNGSIDITISKYIPDNALITSVIENEQPDSLLQLNAALQKIEQEAFTNIIKGGDISQFDKFVSDWKTAGGQKVLDDLNTLYPAK
jgi:putative aldouronate transport system substrate-binding protein